MRSQVQKTEQTEPIPLPDAVSQRLILVGGFFGAGKTMTLSRLGALLRRKGIRVGLLTNDANGELADTAFLRNQDFSTEQISGVPLSDQIEAFTAQLERFTDAEVLIVEAAGNSGQIARRAISSLRQMDADALTIAPLSVLLDPIRAARAFGLEPGARFSDKLAYLYRKQLEEAEIIILNKIDLISLPQRTRLRQFLEQQFSGVSIVETSLREGFGLDEWLRCLMTKEHSVRDLPSVDAVLYARAQASLGWLNCTVRLSSLKYFDAGKVLTELASVTQSALRHEGVDISHLKMALNSDGEPGLAFISVSRNDASPDLSENLQEPVQSGELLLNLRSEADPELLHSAVNRALLALMESSPDLFARMENCEHFRFPAAGFEEERLAGSAA
ncbi:MAG TPA: GTP-binding protein [Verrucomicrobiae bacterium]|nr:GTP-binding protein [Verrucomicrobiae bacterium]